MEYETVLCQTDGAVGIITLNRPEKLNAMSPQLRDDLEAALKALDEGDDVRVVIIKAAGRAFCAGYDISPRPGSSSGGRRSIAQDRDGLRKQHRALAVDVELPQADHRPGPRLLPGRRW